PRQEGGKFAPPHFPGCSPERPPDVLPSAPRRENGSGRRRSIRLRSDSGVGFLNLSRHCFDRRRQRGRPGFFFSCSAWAITRVAQASSLRIKTTSRSRERRLRYISCPESLNVTRNGCTRSGPREPLRNYRTRERM